MKPVTIETIIEMAFQKIAEMEGMVNSDYWKGYCNCFDAMNGNPSGQTWGIVRPKLHDECSKYPSLLTIKK